LAGVRVKHDKTAKSETIEERFHEAGVHSVSGRRGGCVLLAGSPAIAADLTPVPPPAPVFTWTGFELGLHVGGGSDRTRSISTTFMTSPTATIARAFGGAHVGFNYQLMGPLVIGVQGEYNFAGLIGNSSAFPLNYLATSVREFGSADARIGYAFDHLLVYAIGGFAYGDIRGTINFQGFPGFPALTSRLSRQPLLRRQSLRLRCRRRSRI